MSFSVAKINSELQYIENSTPLNSAYCFVSTNERRAKRTLNSIPISNEFNSVHIGCAGWFNLDVMVKRNAHFLIWIDINQNMKTIYDLTKELVIQSADRATFRTNIVQALKTTDLYISIRGNLSGKNHPTDKLEKLISLEMNKYTSWLACEDSYLKIKKAFQENRIAFIGIDFTDTVKFSKIKSLLDENGLFVDTIYVSNVYDWIRFKEEDVSNFFSSLREISCPKTYTIYSAKNELAEPKHLNKLLQKYLDYDSLVIASNSGKFP